MRNIYSVSLLSLLGLSTTAGALTSQFHEQDHGNWARGGFGVLHDECWGTFGELIVCDTVQKIEGNVQTYTSALIDIFSYDRCLDEYKFGNGSVDIPNEFGFFVFHSPTIAKFSVSRDRSWAWYLLESLKKSLQASLN